MELGAQHAKDYRTQGVKLAEKSALLTSRVPRQQTVTALLTPFAPNILLRVEWPASASEWPQSVMLEIESVLDGSDLTGLRSCTVRGLRHALQHYYSSGRITRWVTTA